MRNKISQRKALVWQRRVKELETREERRNARWTSDYPGGVHIDSITVQPIETSILNTAAALGHAVILKHYENNVFRVFAVKP